MSVEILSQSTQKANKDYHCDASEWLMNNGFGYCDFSFSEKRVIAKARRNKYRITKGDMYLKQNNKFSGEIYTFRAIPEIHAICINHDLYEV